jgi:coproporphyrinogen dehydrogenase HemZ
VEDTKERMRYGIVNLDLYRYEIHSLVKAFHPTWNLKILVPDDVEEVTREENRNRRRAHQPENFVFEPVLSVTYSEEAVEITFESTKKRVPAPEGINFAAKSKTLKNALKNALYDLLTKEAGRTLPWGDLIGIRPTKLASIAMEEGKTKEEAAKELMQEHFVSPGKAHLAADIAEREAKILAPLHKSGYSLYVGIPFCPTTCLYCSFPSYNIALYENVVDDYISALIHELTESFELVKGKELNTIYIGGGTPTSLTAEQLDRLLTAIDRIYPVGQAQEYTVEAGRADSITEDKLKILLDHNVTRISVNPQTMNDRTLRLIGRHHSVQQVIDTYYLARSLGFTNINMDIILGLPGEGPEEVAHTVSEIEKLSPDDFTVHSLAIKKASRLREMIDKNGWPVLINTEETMRIAAEGAARMDMHPYYLYRQKNMSGNFENTGYAKDGHFGIYNILIMEELQTILACGAGSVTKRVFREGTRIERCDCAKEVGVYIGNIEEMIDRKRTLFAQ